MIYLLMLFTHFVFVWRVLFYSWLVSWKVDQIFLSNIFSACHFLLYLDLWLIVAFVRSYTNYHLLPVWIFPLFFFFFFREKWLPTMVSNTDMCFPPHLKCSFFFIFKLTAIHPVWSEASPPVMGYLPND